MTSMLAQDWTYRDACAAVDVRDRDRSAISDAPKRSGEMGFFSHHHRLLRSRLGNDSPANLVLLLGSGATGEHAWVHKNVGVATVLGYLVNAGTDPATVPIYRMNPWGTAYGWFLQTDDAQLVPCAAPDRHPAPVLAEALELFDQLKTDSRLAAIKHL